MAIADVDIANMALAKCGVDPITTFTQNDKRAALVNRTYAIYRNKLLRLRWNFNRKYTTLAASTDIPPFEYAYAYPLPADYLRLELAGQPDNTVPPTQTSSGPPGIGIGMPGTTLADFTFQRNQDYRIVGKQIWSNIPPPLAVQYGALIEDPNMFDSAFIDCLACYLAMQWVEPLTNSSTKKQLLAQEFKESKMEALALKSIELPPTTIPDDTFLQSRIAD